MINSRYMKLSLPSIDLRYPKIFSFLKFQLWWKVPDTTVFRTAERPVFHRSRKHNIYAKQGQLKCRVLIAPLE